MIEHCDKEPSRIVVVFVQTSISAAFWCLGNQSVGGVGNFIQSAV